MDNNGKANMKITIIRIPKVKKKDKTQAIKDIANYIVAFATILSLLLTYFTLREMQEERKSAYHPQIQFDNIEYVFQINEDMELIPVVELCPVYSTDESGNANYNFKLGLEVRNIGVGTAKDVKVSISDKAAFKAIEEFNERAVYCNMEYSEGVHGYTIQYSNNTYASALWFENIIEMPYLLPNAEDTRTYELPTVYYCLVHAMRIEHQYVYYDPFEESIMIPDIEIEIEYSDVQGIQYNERAYIHTEGGWAFGGGRSLVVSVISREKHEQNIREEKKHTKHDKANIETIPQTTMEANG